MSTQASLLCQIKGRHALPILHRARCPCLNQALAHPGSAVACMQHDASLECGLPSKMSGLMHRTKTLLCVSMKTQGPVSVVRSAYINNTPPLAKHMSHSAPPLPSCAAYLLHSAVQCCPASPAPAGLRLGSATPLQRCRVGMPLQSMHMAALGAAQHHCCGTLKKHCSHLSSIVHR